MANGKLGKQLSVANSFVTAYTVPASGVQFATVFICAVNTGAEDAVVNIGITTAATPSAGEYLAYGIPLDANGGNYEYPCLICQPGEKIMVYSNKAGVAVRVHGLEQA